MRLKSAIPAFTHWKPKSGRGLSTSSGLFGVGAPISFEKATGKGDFFKRGKKASAKVEDTVASIPLSRGIMSSGLTGFNSYL
jgi:hypothetical protein